MDQDIIIWHLIWTFLVNSYLVDGQEVQITQGRLKGSSEKSRNGTTYFSFLGVPYAKPPVGDLRFKEPQPHPGWSENLNVTKIGNDCPQRSLVNNQLAGDEDCLFLNIHTPKLDPNAMLPVMVYIHGGAFKAGSGGIFRAKFLMDRNIVFVTINYRLGILGFLSFLDDVIFGNFGLRDQIFALKWIQNNIAQFGGDSNRVTIFGGSAGAASVDYLVISPLAKGLFHNAIIQGGTATSPWAFVPQPIALQRAEAVSTLVGCPSRPTAEALKCLRNVSCEVLVQAADKFLEIGMFPLAAFSPVIDSYLGPDQAVVPDYPLVLPPNPGVHIILGFNSYEGNMVASLVCFNDFYLAKAMEKDMTRALPLMSCVQDQVEYHEKGRLVTMLVDYYLKGQNITKDNVVKFADMGTDLIFGHSSFKAALNYYRNVPVYFYLYDIEPRVPLLSLFGDCPHIKGPSHGEEIIFFFDDIFTTVKLNREEEQLSNTLLDLWTKFAETGVPTSSWTPVSSDRIDYLHMTRTGITMKRGLYENRMKFVDSLPLLTNRYDVRHEIEKTEL
uniref:Carboxylic ester hydrolase n=1 Tax=Cacopsylla melanoneura TaxID=428564 RepID=A0A8D8SWB2_9HEMI